MILLYSLFSEAVQRPVIFPNTAFPSQQNTVMPMRPTNPDFRTPMTPNPPTLNPNQYNPIPLATPVPQPVIPSSVISNSSSPPELASTSDLMDRMRQVQVLMVEIHRLENASGERNTQRIQELNQRVMELSSADRHEPTPASQPTPDSQPPPAYFPLTNTGNETGARVP